MLVREGFSLGAFVFGPLWLAAQRAWIAAVIDLALGVLIVALTGNATELVLLAALALAQGLFGRDLIRWSLDRRGYLLAHVIAARDPESALARLLHRRPDLAPSLAGELR